MLVVRIDKDADVIQRDLAREARRPITRELLRRCFAPDARPPGVAALRHPVLRELKLDERELQRRPRRRERGRGRRVHDTHFEVNFAHLDRKAGEDPLHDRRHSVRSEALRTVALGRLRRPWCRSFPRARQIDLQIDGDGANVGVERHCVDHIHRRAR